MSRSCFVVFVLIYFMLDDDVRVCSNVKFEVILENATECQNPVPPFTKKRMMLVETKIHKNKSKTYLTGRTTVLNEVPFQNFSISTYVIDDSGRRELKRRLEKMNCHRFISRLFLEYGNFRYVKKNCRLLKGSYAYKDFDMDKMFHGLPNWHSAGRQLHRIGLTFNGKTIFCNEILLSIKDPQ